MKESRLMEIVVEKLREDGGIGWWEEYEELRRKFELDNEGWLVGKLKNKIKARNEKDWEEEVYKKSTIEMVRLAKDGTGVERYVRSVQGQESVRLLLRLRTGSAGLLEDKKRYRMVSDKKCVMCDNGVGEDVTHFLVGCGEFVRDQLVLFECRIVVVGLWRERWHCCWEKGWRVYIKVCELGLMLMKTVLNHKMSHSDIFSPQVF